MTRHDFNDEEEFGNQGFIANIANPDEAALMQMWTEYARELIGKSTD
jgi:hypothetical protein